MKEKLKYNFLYIIPLHYSKFYNYFFLCCAQGRHFFVAPSVQRKTILSTGAKLKKDLQSCFY